MINVIRGKGEQQRKKTEMWKFVESDTVYVNIRSDRIIQVNLDTA